MWSFIVQQGPAGGLLIKGPFTFSIIQDIFTAPATYCAATNTFTIRYMHKLSTQPLPLIWTLHFLVYESVLLVALVEIVSLINCGNKNQLPHEF